MIAIGSEEIQRIGSKERERGASRYDYGFY